MNHKAVRILLTRPYFHCSNGELHHSPLLSTTRRIDWHYGKSNRILLYRFSALLLGRYPTAKRHLLASGPLAAVAEDRFTLILQKLLEQEQ